MRKKLTFDQVFTELRQNIQDAIVKECIHLIENDDILFSPGIIQEKTQLASLYRFRLSLKKDKRDAKEGSSEIELKSWEEAVEKLDKYNCEFAALNSIQTTDKMHFFFWDNETGVLISNFWLFSQNTLAESEENNNQSKKRGHTVSQIKFSKGKQVRDWK